MSNAFRCDRCKKFYSRDEEDSKKRIGYHGALIHGMAITDKYRKVLEYFDLCPDCVKALDDFMNRPDIEEDEDDENAIDLMDPLKSLVTPRIQ